MLRFCRRFYEWNRSSCRKAKAINRFTTYTIIFGILCTISLYLSLLRANSGRVAAAAAAAAFFKYKVVCFGLFIIIIIYLTLSVMRCVGKSGDYRMGE